LEDAAADRFPADHPGDDKPEKQGPMRILRRLRRYTRFISWYMRRKQQRPIFKADNQIIIRGKWCEGQVKEAEEHEHDADKYWKNVQKGKAKDKGENKGGDDAVNNDGGQTVT